MTTPIFVLGCHRSGTSAVSGLLHRACGVSMGRLMPATGDNPIGYFEAQGVVDAHRGLLRQMERDWTCPPDRFDPAALDLSALAEEVAIHRSLPEPWAMKDPRSMFLLPAWSHLGVDRVRLVAVARPPVDTITSIRNRDDIREDRAEAIVEAHLGRLLEIAEQVPLPVIRFPGDRRSVTDQVRSLADSLGLPWDQAAAEEFFREALVRNRAALQDTSPTYDRLLEASSLPDTVPATDLASLDLGSRAATWPLDTHLGPHHAVQRNQLWGLARFEAFDRPRVVELLLQGARPGGRRPRRLDVHQLETPSAQAAGSVLLDSGLHPHGVVATGLVTDRSLDDVEFLLRAIHIATHPMAELVIDVPNPVGDALDAVRPGPADRPTPDEVRELAGRCGWDLVMARQLSPARQGMVLRKRLPTANELAPMTEELMARAHRIAAIDDRLRAVESKLPGGTPDVTRPAVEIRKDDRRVKEAEERAVAAERATKDLRNRSSVRLALAVADRLGPAIRAVRSLRG